MENTEYFDRAGVPIPRHKYERLAVQREYTVVDADTVHGKDGKPLFVSTIWTGFDAMNGRGGAPHIFETVVFEIDDSGLPIPPSEGSRRLPFDYYADEYDAVVGHEYIKHWIKEWNL